MIYALVTLAASGLLMAPLAPAGRMGVASARFPSVCMQEQSEWEKYRAERGEASLQEAQDELNTFKTLRDNLEEFDGGDSGSGAVGDGNVDLEDQHNSATLGALRGGVSDLGTTSVNVGRGNVKTLDDDTKIEGATTARTASAGANYFGRSTGLADKLINEISEDDVKTGRMDKVRAQQKENWFNQRAIHASNRAQGQGVVYGEQQGIQPREGGFNAQAALSSDAWRHGGGAGEVSQRDLANHMSSLAALPAERLDGEEWGELQLTEADEIVETFELRASPRQTAVQEIPVRNDFNTFAPFRCGFLPGSSFAFSCDPAHGSMNRRSGEPTMVTVRFKPESSGEHMGMFVFETEDMKKVYLFIGGT